MLDNRGWILNRFHLHLADDLTADEILKVRARVIGKLDQRGGLLIAVEVLGSRDKLLVKDAFQVGRDTANLLRRQAHHGPPAQAAADARQAPEAGHAHGCRRRGRAGLHDLSSATPHEAALNESHRAPERRDQTAHRCCRHLSQLGSDPPTGGRHPDGADRGIDRSAREVHDAGNARACLR